MIIAIMLEEKTAIGAKTSIEELIKLTPKLARRIEGKIENDVNVSELAVGDVVRVRPGENFPADGEVISGNSTVNQASITGEVTMHYGEEILFAALDGHITLAHQATNEENPVHKQAFLMPETSPKVVPQQ